MSYVNGKWTVKQEIDTEELMHNVQTLLKQNNSLASQLEDIPEIKAYLEKMQKTLEEINKKSDQKPTKSPNQKILNCLLVLAVLGNFYLYFLHQQNYKIKKAPLKKAELVKVIQANLT